MNKQLMQNFLAQAAHYARFGQRGLASDNVRHALTLAKTEIGRLVDDNRYGDALSFLKHVNGEVKSIRHVLMGEAEKMAQVVAKDSVGNDMTAHDWRLKKAKVIDALFEMMAKNGNTDHAQLATRLEVTQDAEEAIEILSSAGLSHLLEIQ